MALWRHFNSIVPPPGTEDNFHGVYSLPRDELIICLRVVFANWIEASIGKILPANFFKALEFQIESALQKQRTLPAERTNLRHFAKLSAYQRFLQKYKAQDTIDELYRKFVHCLHEEYKVIRLYQMDNFIPTELYDMIESLEKDFGRIDNVQGQSDLCMHMLLISNESCRFPNMVEELRNLVYDLGASFERFYRSHQDFKAHQFFQGPREAIENEPYFNLLTIVSNELLDQAQQIVRGKAAVEHRLREIHETSSMFIRHLQNYLHCNEKLHAFQNRSTKTNVEELGVQAEKALLFLKEVCYLSGCVVDVNSYNYLNILNISREVMMTLSTIRANAGNERAELWNRDSFSTTEINVLMQQLENLQWSIYQNCTLVMESQPPLLIIKGSRRPIAVRFFNLGNVLSSDFKVKVYLVNKNTVKDIRTGSKIPDTISKITPQSKSLDSIAGKILIVDAPHPTSRESTSTGFRGRGRQGRQPRNQIGRSSKESMDSLPGSTVVNLMQENVQNTKSAYFDKLLVVKTINRSSEVKIKIGSRVGRRTTPSEKGNSEKVTSDKVALLFVAEIPFKNEIRQVWTISLPMIIAAHGSQHEKAYATMAWDEVMFTQTRKGFEVNDTANWGQVSKMIKGTFEILVGEPLKPHHLLYIKRKLEQHMHMIGISLEDHTTISKNVLGSFWLWFYRSILIIKINSPFHDAWKSGYIEGFISYADATKILLTNSPQTKPGRLILRFSDSVIGGLTIVFLAFDKRVYKMQPMDFFRKVALKDWTKILLGQLDLKENVYKKDIFSHVYPNIPKELAFKNFYECARKNPTPTFQGYVVLSTFVPLSGPTSPTESCDELSPSVSNNDGKENNTSLPTTTTDCSSLTLTNQVPDQFLGWNFPTSSQASFPTERAQQMEITDEIDLNLNIQPSDIRNYRNEAELQLQVLEVISSSTT